jgi:hypothetical protein
MIKDSLIKAFMSFPRTRESRSCRSYKFWIPANAGMTKCAYFLLFLLALSGCEVVTDTNGLPYQDLIVVKGYVQDGQPVDSILFTQTLPLNVTYTNAQTIISGVSGYISVDGQQYPLQYADSGYYNCPGLVGHAGKTYALDASWNGLHVHGVTTVPILPVIDSVYLTPGRTDTNQGFIDSFYVNDTIHYDTAFTTYNVVGALWVYTESIKGAALSINYDYYHSLGTLTNDSEWFPGIIYGGGEPVYLDTSMKGSIWASSPFSLFGTDSIARGQKYRADVYSYDPAYYNFLQTQYNSQYNNGVFSSGGGLNPDWNVSGDGFGIFIGVSEAHKIFTY